MNEATFQSKDQNWTDEKTTYWFAVELADESMILGVVEQGNSEPKIVDEDGAPIDGAWFEGQVSFLPELVTDEVRAS